MGSRNERIGIVGSDVFLSLHVDVRYGKPYNPAGAEDSSCLPEEENNLLLIEMLEHMRTIENFNRAGLERKTPGCISILDGVFTGKLNEGGLILVDEADVPEEYRKQGKFG
jgi:hypothetical protein